jgi:hypothetical protein
MYSPAPATGRKVLPLVKPELYDLSQDSDESYDVAEAHQDVVNEILVRIERLMPGFPPDIAKAWVDQKARAAIQVPAGSLPRAPQ